MLRLLFTCVHVYVYVLCVYLRACIYVYVCVCVNHQKEYVELDEEFRETHFALLERFFKMFESIYKYIMDFKTYLDEMNEGFFVTYTIEVREV